MEFHFIDFNCFEYFNSQIKWNINEWTKRKKISFAKQFFLSDSGRSHPRSNQSNIPHIKSLQRHWTSPKMKFNIFVERYFFGRNLFLSIRWHASFFQSTLIFWLITEHWNYGRAYLWRNVLELFMVNLRTKEFQSLLWGDFTWRMGSNEKRWDRKSSCPSMWEETFDSDVQPLWTRFWLQKYKDVLVFISMRFALQSYQWILVSIHEKSQI